MTHLKSLFALAFVVGLTACSSTPNEGSGDTDLKPLGGSDAQAVQNGEDLDLGVEIIGVEIGGSATSGNLLTSDAANNLEVGEMKPVVYFGFDESELNEQNTPIVKHYAEFLMDNPDKKVVLKGHTDERGTPEYNLALGERRANSVQRVMMLFGVDQSRIENISFGEEQPEAFENTEAAWQKNRRVEIQIQ